MAIYCVEVEIRQHSRSHAHAHFKSRATTAGGITRAASKALRREGYRTFEEPTTRDIALVVGGRLAGIISDYQRQGLFQ